GIRDFHVTGVQTCALPISVRKYCPAVRLEDLAVYRSANRAQAVRRDGTLVDDFLIERIGDGITAILNAPSPAATSAMPIAARIEIGRASGREKGTHADQAR